MIFALQHRLTRMRGVICTWQVVYAGFGLSRKSDRMSPSGIEFRMLDREYVLHSMLHFIILPLRPCAFMVCQLSPSAPSHLRC